MPWLLLLALLVASNQVLPEWRRGFDRPEQSARTSRDVLLEVFGESRTIMARALWFKMDIYHEVLDEQGVPHERQGEVFPLLRLVTQLDPHFEDAYDILAWDLTAGYKRPEAALEVLEEGLAYNPQSRLLHFRKAMILQKQGRHSEALRHATRAYLLAHDTTGQYETGSEHFNRLNALRLMFASQRALEDVSGMENTLKTWTGLAPEDPALDLRHREVEEVKRSSTRSQEDGHHPSPPG